MIVSLLACQGSVRVDFETSVRPAGDWPADDAIALFLPVQGIDAWIGDGPVRLAGGPDPYNLLDVQPDGSEEVYDVLSLDRTTVALDEVSAGTIVSLTLVLMDEPLPTLIDFHGDEHGLDIVGDERFSAKVDLQVAAGTETSVVLTFDPWSSLVATGEGYQLEPGLGVLR